MYKTKEIRWFFKTENTQIQNWFKNHELNASNIREDLYLQLNDENIGVKLRDGAIEVKHRTRARSKGCLITDVWGCFEHWTKWSFEAKSDDPVLLQITQGIYERWISVEKERLALQLTEINGKTKLFSLSQSLDYGCQIEYTKLKIMGEKWYTFGLEWFGNTHMELETSLISQILGNTKLSIKDSISYPAFLSAQENLSYKTLP
ncbi:hypothetical protein [uncultured Kriegella sp.]|uniref:hypothetical protein n=1 Tax=uncultured Kriegella sp. TaxID=1798910 RepID=UPI0030DA805E|tara:strand:- start:21444 stop:22055 length:612 start_codon:yes stop_codon:yes gene_type:complete